MDEFLQKVEQKEKEFAELYGRMDSDKKLLIQEDYVMRDRNDREEPDVDNITMNDPAVFANRVHNTLIRADIIPEVEGEKLKDEDTTPIEKFITAIGAEADEAINWQDIPSFKDWEVMQACDRGRVARRITLMVEEDKSLSPLSFLPIDSRYLIYEPGVKGFKWVATRMSRRREDIKEEYDWDIKSSNAVVTDFWDDEFERVYVGRNQVAENPNVYKEPPFVIQVIPSGLLTMDDDRVLFSGESIFGLNRDLYPEKNLFASILKTLTIRSFFGGMQIEVPDPALAKKPAIPPYRKKIVVPVEKGTKGYFNMPITDVHNAARMFYSLLDGALQSGALPKVSYGTLQFPLSAVAIADLKEAEDPVYLPRIQGLALYWQKVYRMVIKQYIQFKMNLSLGEAGFKKQYSYRDLDKDCSIKFRFFIKSPKQDMANISTAAAVGDLVDEDTKRRDYLHLENPTDIEQKLLIQKAKKMSPAIDMYETCKALIEKDMKIEAALLAEEIGLSIDQILSGQVVPKKPIEEKKPTQLLPMFGGQGGRVSPPEGENAETE